MVSLGHFLHFLVNFKNWRWNIKCSKFSQWKLYTVYNILSNFDFSLLSKHVRRPWKKQKITKIVILDIFCIFYLFFMNEDKILLCELFLCRKYTTDRAAGENLTFVTYCPNQFQGTENSKKWMNFFHVIFQLFFGFTRKILKLEMGYSYLRFLHLIKADPE